MKYKNPYTRQNPNLIVILLDQRASMCEPYNETLSRMDFAAKMVNTLLNEITCNCLNGNGNIYNRAFIEVLGYGNNGVMVIISCWIKDIENHIIREENINQNEIEFNFPIFVDPCADYGFETPEEAFNMTKRNLIAWKERPQSNKENDPVPLIINISRGDIYSYEVEKTVNEIKSIEFDDGNPLIYNFILRDNGENSVLFPKSDIESNYKQDILLSSDLPIEIATLTNVAGNKNFKLMGGEKACIINPQSTNIKEYVPLLMGGLASSNHLSFFKS